MQVKNYGESDADLSAENMLREITRGLAVEYYILHQRMPVEARPCRRPDSLTVQAKLKDGSFITVRQDCKGATPKRVT